MRAVPGCVRFFASACKRCHVKTVPLVSYWLQNEDTLPRLKGHAYTLNLHATLELTDPSVRGSSQKLANCFFTQNLSIFGCRHVSPE